MEVSVCFYFLRKLFLLPFGLKHHCNLISPGRRWHGCPCSVLARAHAAVLLVARHLVLGVVAEAAADPVPLRVTAEPFVRDFVHDVREVKFTLMP